MSAFDNATLMITGGTGSFGSTVLKHFLDSDLKEIRIFSRDEKKQDDMRHELQSKHPETANKVKFYIGDVRNLQSVCDAMSGVDYIFHAAALKQVPSCEFFPMQAVQTNVMGTVNVCECVRLSKSAGADGYEGVRSFVNVTTDKVYDNKERSEGGYREEEPLDGYDPYSNSKSCSELVTHSYVRSFLADSGIAVSTARAGNVIGGGDFAVDRIIPDCVRAALEKREIVVRNPYSVRPYQHVLEPVCVYLMIAMEQYVNRELSGWYNVGPDDTDCVTTGELVNIFTDCWKGTKWQVKGDGGPHEAGFLKLNCDKLKDTFSWKPVWNIRTAVQKTVEFSMLLDSTLLEGMHCGSRKIADETEALTGTEQETKALSGNNFSECMDRQIMEYIADARKA